MLTESGGLTGLLFLILLPLATRHALLYFLESRRAVTGARSVRHSGKAMEPTGAALGCPPAEDSDHELCVPSSAVQRWHVLGCGAPAHPTLLVWCPG